MFCIVVMENFGCADFVSNPGAEYSIYGLIKFHVQHFRSNKIKLHYARQRWAVVARGFVTFSVAVKP